MDENFAPKIAQVSSPVEQELTLLRQNLDRTIESVNYLEQRLDTVLTRAETPMDSVSNPAAGFSDLATSIHSLAERVEYLGSVVSNITYRVEL